MCLLLLCQPLGTCGSSEGTLSVSFRLSNLSLLDAIYEIFANDTLRFHRRLVTHSLRPTYLDLRMSSLHPQFPENWDGHTKVQMPESWNRTQQFTIGGHTFNKGDAIFILFATEDGEKDFPAKILDIGVKDGETALLVAWYMWRDRISERIHKGDKKKWADIKRKWATKGKYYALTNELQFVNMSSIQGTHEEFPTEIDPKYIFFCHGTRYQRRRQFRKWSDVPWSGEDLWWNGIEEEAEVEVKEVAEEDKVVEKVMGSVPLSTPPGQLGLKIPRSVAGSMAGYTLYRNEHNSFMCPITGCENSYPGYEALRHHINICHTFPENPYAKSPKAPDSPRINNQCPLQHAPILSTPIQHVRTAGVSPAHAENPPGSLTGSFVVSTTLNIPIVSPSTQDQLPLLVSENLDLSDHRTWIESSSQWPPQTLSYLKRLMIHNDIFETPKTNLNNGKFFVMFEQFYTKINFRGWQPAKDDEKLVHLFRLKVNQIAEEMLRSGEILQLPMGLRLSNLSQRKVGRSASRKHTNPPSTPPATPGLPKDKLLDGLELWNSSDADVQAQLFRKQLRSAKDPQRLIFEWEEYCAKIRRKAQVTGDQVQGAEPMKSVQGPTPSKTPLPAPKTLDLKKIMEDRLREFKLKREMEKHQKENEPKRIKTDTL